jgi:hypothetical protein
MADALNLRIMSSSAPPPPATTTTASTATTDRDKPWPLLRLLSIDPDPMTFVFNF